MYMYDYVWLHWNLALSPGPPLVVLPGIYKIIYIVCHIKFLMGGAKATFLLQVSL